MFSSMHSSHHSSVSSSDTGSQTGTSFIPMDLCKKIAYGKLFIGYLTCFTCPHFHLFQEERGLMGKSSSAK